MGIVALVLAAGKSSRMGSDKLSMRLRAEKRIDQVHHKINAEYAEIEQLEHSIAKQMWNEDVDRSSHPSHNDKYSDNSPGVHYKTYTSHEKSDATVGGQVISVLLQTSVFSSLIIVQSPESSSAWQQECTRWQQLHPEIIQSMQCTDAAQGMSHSIRSGVEYARNMSAEALMIVLADQPLIEAPYIEQLVIHSLQHPELDYVAATGSDGAAPPIVFAARVWDRLEQLTGDQGARRLLSDPELKGARIALPDYCFWDADTPEALERIQLFLAKAE